MRLTKKKIIITVILLALLAVFCWFQNNYITVSEYTYETEKISAENDGFIIVHISDLHNKTFGKNQKRLLNKVADCLPDIILVTGDIAGRRDTEFSNAETFIKEAVKLAPVYYVTGNHEEDLLEGEFNELISGIEAAGAMWLDDELTEVLIGSGKDRLNIAGISNGSLTGPVAQKLSENADHSQLTMLLAHQPQLLDYYAAQGYDMVFSGHAHGGQMRLPFIGGIIAPGQGFFPEYTEEAHVKDNTTMYISRGLGNSICPLRLFNCPEVVCVRLELK